MALNNFQIYLEDYHTAGYRISQSIHDLISQEICATLTTVCSLCLRAPDVEDEVKSSIDGWVSQQRKRVQIASLQDVQNRLQDTEAEAAPLQPSPAAAKQKAAPKFLVPNPALLDGKDTVNRKQAAEALGVVTRTLDRWIADEKVTPIGPGGRKRFKTLDLKRLLNQKLKDK